MVEPSANMTTSPTVQTAPQNDCFLRACRREKNTRTPVWLMRQAGRYMAEYRALRSRHTILEMIRDPALAAEVTMQPVDAFDLDAAIIFADILPILDEMGLGLEFIRGEGPMFHHPVKTPADLDRLRPRPAREALGYTIEAVRETLRRLKGRIPLIGFSGAPFTLACYAIEGHGSRDFLGARRFMCAEPAAFHRLMDILSAAIADYLVEQARAGCHAVQLFDSWVGILGPADYREFVLPYNKRILDTVRAETGVPSIHFGTNTTGILPLLREAGGDVIGVDWRIDLTDALKLLGNGVAVQGNLDPALLLGPQERMRSAAAAILDAAKDRAGFIFNLGHGIHKETPPENVAALVDFVHQYRP